VIVLAFLAVSAYSQLYIVSDSAGGTIFWKKDEAFLFLGTSHTGYRFSYLKYPFVVAGEYFAVPPRPSDERASAVVIRITPTTIKRHVVDYGDDTSENISFLTPFEDGIYAMCKGAILCKWSGNGFSPATQEEVRRHGGLDGLIKGGVIDKPVNGWQVRYAGSSPGYRFEVQLADKLMLLIQNHAEDPRAYPWISVDLLRQGQAPENLYNTNETPRRITRAEYDQIFQGSKRTTP
jgi:hypothetical protein